MAAQRVVIVGGGMVGISLALLLAKARDQLASHGFAHDLNITLIEKFPFPATTTQETLEKSIQQPSFDTRSTALSAGSINILRDLGVWAELSEHAEAISDIHISDRGHYTSTHIKADDYAIDALGYVIENHIFGQCLLKQLLSADIECLAPATVSACQMKRHGVELHIEHAAEGGVTSLFADAVLIADGADSPLRKSIGIDSTITDYQQSAIIANVALAKPHQGIAYERFTDQGPLALLPLSDYSDGSSKIHRAALVWTRNTNEADTLMQLDNSDFLRSLQHCFGYRADYFLEVGSRQCYPLQLVQASEQVRSHVALLGNAAHFLHPVAGQGFNLSLRDVAAMVDVLMQAMKKGQPMGAYSTLKNYEQARERDQGMTIGLTDTLVKLFSSEQWSLSVSRQLGLMGLQAIPAAKQTLARQMMGVR